MTHSIDYTDVRLYQDYLKKFSNEIFTRTFYGFPSANLVRAIEGVKGIEVFTEIQVMDDLIRKWSCDQPEIDNVIKPSPVELKAPLNGVTLKICPQDIEVKGYLSDMRRKGQDPDDFPIAKLITDPSMGSMNEQMERSLWEAKELAVVPANAPLQDTFDGFATIAKKAGVAGKASVVATGPITAANAVNKMDDVYAPLHKSLKRKGCQIWVSYELFEKYKIAYMTAYNNNAPAYIAIQGVDYEGIRHRLNSKVIITPVEGLTGDKIIVTNKENLLYGFDAVTDVANWNVQRLVRQILIWCDLRFGAQILLQRPGFLIVNDQL